MEDVVKVFISGAKKVYKLKGFTQRTLADAVGSNQGTLSSYFILRTRIKPDMMQKISKVLETPYEDILNIGREELNTPEGKPTPLDKKAEYKNNITLLHQDIVQKFKDKDEGYAANKALLAIEELDEFVFLDVVKDLKMIAKHLKIAKEKGEPIKPGKWKIDRASNQD